MSSELTIIFLRYGIVALLYFFLVLVLVAILRDVRRVQNIKTPIPDWGKLIVLEPGKTGLSAGDSLPLESVNFFGRAASNTFQLPDDFASSKHALLAYRQRQWWLEDLGSTNGTMLNGQQVSKPSIVMFGDVIEIGRTILRLEKAE